MNVRCSVFLPQNFQRKENHCVLAFLVIPGLLNLFSDLQWPNCAGIYVFLLWSFLLLASQDCNPFEMESVTENFIPNLVRWNSCLMLELNVLQLERTFCISESGGPRPGCIQRERFIQRPEGKNVSVCQSTRISRIPTNRSIFSSDRPQRIQSHDKNIVINGALFNLGVKAHLMVGRVFELGDIVVWL